MTFYSAFQSNAYWSKNYQIARAPVPSGGGKEEGYTYITPYQRLKIEEEKREKIKKAKTDLDRVENVLRETERKKALAAESARLARKRESLKRAIELEKLQSEYLEEINRLLVVRAELMRRIGQEEALLVIMIIARKRRFRTIRITGEQKTLAL